MNRPKCGKENCKGEALIQCAGMFVCYKCFNKFNQKISEMKQKLMEEI